MCVPQITQKKTLQFYSNIFILQKKDNHSRGDNSIAKKLCSPYK